MARQCHWNMTIISINHISWAPYRLPIIPSLPRYPSFVFLCHHRTLQEMGFGYLRGNNACLHACCQGVRAAVVKNSVSSQRLVWSTCIPFLNYKTVFFIWSCAQLHRSIPSIYTISTSHVSCVEKSNKANKRIEQSNKILPTLSNLWILPGTLKATVTQSPSHPIRALLRSSRFSTSLDTRASSRVIKPVRKDGKGRCCVNQWWWNFWFLKDGVSDGGFRGSGVRRWKWNFIYADSRRFLAGTIPKSITCIWVSRSSKMFQTVSKISNLLNKN